MPTRNVVPTERQETLVETLVHSGRCQNASEVVREGPRMIENREVEDAAKLEGLPAAALVGLSALGRGAFKEFADAPTLRAHLESLGVATASGARDK